VVGCWGGVCAASNRGGGVVCVVGQCVCVASCVAGVCGGLRAPCLGRYTTTKCCTMLVNMARKVGCKSQQQVVGPNAGCCMSQCVVGEGRRPQRTRTIEAQGKHMCRRVAVVHVCGSKGSRMAWCLSVSPPAVSQGSVGVSGGKGMCKAGNKQGRKKEGTESEKAGNAANAGKQYKEAGNTRKENAWV